MKAEKGLNMPETDQTELTSEELDAVTGGDGLNEPIGEADIYYCPKNPTKKHIFTNFADKNGIKCIICGFSYSS